MKECAKHAREEDVDAKVRKNRPDDDSLILHLSAFVLMNIVLIYTVFIKSISFILKMNTADR